MFPWVVSLCVSGGGDPHLTGSSLSFGTPFQGRKDCPLYIQGPQCPDASRAIRLFRECVKGIAPYVVALLNRWRRCCPDPLFAFFKHVASMKHGMLCEASHDLIVIDARIPLRQKSYDFRCERSLAQLR